MRFHVQKEQEIKLEQILEHPLLTFEDAVSVSGTGSYTIGCSDYGSDPI